MISKFSEKHLPPNFEHEHTCIKQHITVKAIDSYFVQLSGPISMVALDPWHTLYTVVYLKLNVRTTIEFQVKVLSSSFDVTYVLVTNQMLIDFKILIENCVLSRLHVDRCVFTIFHLHFQFYRWSTPTMEDFYPRAGVPGSNHRHIH